ncbi:MAG: methylenetetrahydrofolate reductase [NAD(P)H] [Opitutaceae bacterium]|jgi:methylenetetrahydrofolate reductase (NADPH)|nr:methylenetetrahydrofolate reductase [NAD(P)H] [Opitutaceae bacterium]
MSSDRPISTLFPEHRPLRSLEFFPPRDDAGVESLRAAATALRKVPWDFVSVTYGAGGSTRQRTTQVSRILKDKFGFTVMPHLTCVGHTRAELDDLADRLHADGFRNIMALRGDPPKGDTAFTPAPDGLRHANELVALLRQRHPDFCLGVAGYPEKHPEAATFEADLDALKHKIDAGAAFVTTQLFFDNAIYARFVEKCQARGIRVPIIPGIMPVLSIKQIQRIATLSGTRLPAALSRRLEVASENPDVVEVIGIDWALDQIRGLLALGAPGYHLYILNRAKSALALAAGLAA